MSEMAHTIRFVIFCLEAYKRAEGLNGREAAARFVKYGVTAYLRDGYDVLHTLGEAALVDDVRKYLKVRL